SGALSCDFFFSSRRRHTRSKRDWSSDVCSSDLVGSLPRWMWILAGVAAVINASHGVADAGFAAGLALGALSLLGVVLHSIRQNQIGRASCRERVEMAEGGGCVKRKRQRERGRDA